MTNRIQPRPTALENSMSMSWLMTGIIETRLRESVSDGIKAAIHLFYEDYPKADDVMKDAEFYGAIVTLAEYTDYRADQLVEEVEETITKETGRTFAKRED